MFLRATIINDTDLAAKQLWRLELVERALAHKYRKQDK